MFGNNFQIKRIRAEARHELSSDDDAAMTQLWNRVYAAFNQWKLERGDRNPIPNRGLLSDLLPIPFDKAEPWECVDFIFSSPVALTMKLLREDYAPFDAITAKVGIRKVLALAIVKSDKASDDDLLEAGEILRAHANIEIGLRAGFEAAREPIKKNLEKGRPIGVKARQEKSAKKQTALIDAIKALFDKPEKPGWGWTNPQIVTFLKRSNYGYADSTLMGTVKSEAAKYRKARKAEQDSKYLNR